MKVFFERVVVGAIILLFLAVIIFLGERTLLLSTTILSILAFLELNKVLNKIDCRSYISLEIVCGILCIYSFYIKNFYMFLLAIIALLLSTSILTVFHKKNSIKKVMSSLFIGVYIFLPFGLLNDLSREAIYIILLASWGTDSFAYLFGSIFGKHPLIPSISPKKSIEGAVGGIIGAVGLAFLIFYLLDLPLFKASILIIFASILAQLGDLFASKIKREGNVKDYGHIFRAHGGVMDRFDSMLFVIPFIYIIFQFIDIF